MIPVKTAEITAAERGTKGVDGSGAVVGGGDPGCAGASSKQVILPFPSPTKRAPSERARDTIPFPSR